MLVPSTRPSVYFIKDTACPPSPFSAPAPADLAVRRDGDPVRLAGLLALDLVAGDARTPVHLGWFPRQPTGALGDFGNVEWPCGRSRRTCTHTQNNCCQKSRRRIDPKSLSSVWFACKLNETEHCKLMYRVYKLLTHIICFDK